MTKTLRGRSMLAAVAVAAMLLLSACQNPVESGGGGDGEGGGGGGEPVELSFAHSYTTDNPHHRCGAQLVADTLNEQEDLEMTVEIFPNSQLGGDTDRFASVVSGDIDVDIQGSSALAATWAPIGLLDRAYVFDGPDHLLEFFDGEDGQQLQADFEENTGAHILDVWYFGMRHFTANSPIRVPADLQGLRMRFPDSPIYLANAEALGASPTAVAFEEVFLSLQQGIIDGQENPIPTIVSLNLPEVQSHVSLTGHQTGSQLVVVSGQTWESLSAEQQEALTNAVHETRAANRQCIEEDAEKYLNEWKETGAMTVVEDVDREAFQQRAEEYFTANLEGEELELYETIRAAAP